MEREKKVVTRWNVLLTAHLFPKPKFRGRSDSLIWVTTFKFKKILLKLIANRRQKRVKSISQTIQSNIIKCTFSFKENLLNCIPVIKKQPPNTKSSAQLYFRASQNVSLTYSNSRESFHKNIFKLIYAQKSIKVGPKITSSQGKILSCFWP